jgi:hypothetical protein
MRDGGAASRACLAAAPTAIQDADPNAGATSPNGDAHKTTPNLRGVTEPGLEVFI